MKYVILINYRHEGGLECTHHPAGIEEAISGIWGLWQRIKVKQYFDEATRYKSIWQTK